MAQVFTDELDQQSLTQAKDDIETNFAAVRSSFSGTSRPVDPAPVAGQLFWHEDDETLEVFDGDAWVLVPFTFESTLQDSYDVSTDGQILTDATRGSVKVKRGSSLETDIVLEVRNNAGTTTYSIDGNGLVNIAGGILSPGSGGAGSFRAGSNADSSGANSLSIGLDSVSSGGSSAAFARGAEASGSGALSVGIFSEASHTDSSAFGRDATTTQANQIMLGSSAAVVTCPNDLEIKGEIGEHKRQVISHSSGTLNLTSADYGSIILVSGSAGAINLPTPVLGAGFLIKTTGSTSIPLATASGNIVIDGISSPGWLAEDAYSWIDIVGSSGTVWQELRRDGAWEVEV